MNNKEKADLFDKLSNELISSSDYILSYVKCLMIVSGGTINIDKLKEEHKWPFSKVGALSAACTHFAARGLIKKIDSKTFSI